MDFTIKKRITEEELDNLFWKGFKKKWIGGEQWFRNPENWYAITAYANPYKTPYSEMVILNNNEEDLAEMLSWYKKVFYGVGVGDSEILPIKWDLKKNKHSEIIAIDLSEKFLFGFMQSLKNLRLEFPDGDIQFKGLVDLFENIKREDFKLKRENYHKVAHICLGNTVGNFRQEEIFSIFKKNMQKNDLLMLGIQLAENPERILLQYSNNPLFEKLILDSLKEGNKNVKINWRYDRTDDIVEAWAGDVMVFRSKKYNLSKLRQFAKRFGFRIVKEYKYQNGEGGFAIIAFKKIN